jgi:hypothetical protein
MELKNVPRCSLRDSAVIRHREVLPEVCLQTDPHELSG